MLGGRLSMPRSFGALLLVAMAGFLLLPWQIHLQKAARAAGFQTTSLDLDLREQIGQSGFLAALSGFRAPLAAILWIEAHSAWEKTEWGRMEGLFDTVTTLQPHTLLYWDNAAWHMAWNASAASLQDLKQPSEILRERMARQYVALGRNFLERGIRNNPDQYLLYERLGFLLRDKEQDHAGAADAFSKAASFPDAPAYLKRFAAYETAQSPGREREAYRRLLELYNEGEKQRVPTLVTRLRELEEKLEIPMDQRIPVSHSLRTTP
jgi:hypothetical protein